MRASVISMGSRHAAFLSAMSFFSLSRRVVLRDPDRFIIGALLLQGAWQYLCANWISNRVFDNYGDIIAAACNAWNRLVAQPKTIKSIGMREWAHIGQT